MKRKIVWVIGLLMILCLSVQMASAEGFSKEDWYKMGIASLEELTEESIQNAADYFQAAGNYGQAQNYKQYTSSLLDVLAMDDQETELDITAYRLKKISDNQEFNASLSENGLPSCKELTTYIQGRLYEREGDYFAASNIYDSIINVLDALDRQVELMPYIYNQACKLYEAEQYEAAGEIFLKLSQDDWKDSAEMYQKAFRNMPHIWIEADCTHPRTCTRHGETEGKPLGHDWQEVDGKESRVCKRCGAMRPTVAGAEVYSGYYKYVPLSDGTIRITAYYGSPEEYSDGTIKISYPFHSSSDLLIPKELDGKLVSEIGNSVFSGDKFYTSVTIPDSVVSIGAMAFSNCPVLENVIIPDSVTIIGKNAFAVSGLKSVTLSNNLTRIEEGVFSNNHSLTEIMIPDSVTEIGDYAFACSALTDCVIPDSVTSIGSDSFGNCPALTSITIPDSVNNVGNNPFSRCPKLENIIVSAEHPYLSMVDGVLFSKLDQRLISYPTALTADTYAVPEGTRIIGSNAFYDSSLEKISIPESVTTIGDYAFTLCSSLISVTIPQSVTSIGEGIFSYSKSVVVTVEQNSYANQYCVYNGLKYKYR